MADEKPSFKVLFEQYVKAYNLHSFPEIEKQLSPKVYTYFKGEKIAEGYGEVMKKYYTDHWALPNCKIAIEKIEEKKDEDAVEVQIVDHARNKLVSARYTWAKEDGKWLHVKHEVTEVIDWAPGS